MEKILLSQVLMGIIVVILLFWLFKMLLSRNFWKRVGGHVVDGIAKKISGVIILLIILAVAALIASIAHK